MSGVPAQGGAGLAGQPVTNWDYSVYVHKVVDGDTIDLEVDVGFYLTTRVRVRLIGIDTPERGQAGWADGTAFTSRWLAARFGKLRARTYKTDSFGRWIADVYAGDEHLSVALVEGGYAVPYRLI